MPHIFLSHSSEDETFTHNLVDQLKAELPGVEVFASSEADAIPSGEWQPTVFSNLAKADAFIAVITPLAEKSIWVAFEYGYFWRHKQGKNIHILRHPNAILYSPFSILQSKSILASDELRVFFQELCQNFEKDYQGRADIDVLVEIASNLPVLSSEDRKLKADLILSMRSTDNATALNAVLRLQERGWLYDGSLRGKVFSRAKLHGADLTRADLQRAKLDWADLREVDFTYANLQDADLGGAHFGTVSDEATRAATFWNADLRNATLSQATLFGVNFGLADLRGTNLTSAKLLMARGLNTAKYDNNTILPDGSNWTPNTDVQKYTSPSLEF